MTIKTSYVRAVKSPIKSSERLRMNTKLSTILKKPTLQHMHYIEGFPNVELNTLEVTRE